MIWSRWPGCRWRSLGLRRSRDHLVSWRGRQVLSVGDAEIQWLICVLIELTDRSIDGLVDGQLSGSSCRTWKRTSMWSTWIGLEVALSSVVVVITLTVSSSPWTRKQIVWKLPKDSVFTLAQVRALLTVDFESTFRNLTPKK